MFLDSSLFQSAPALCKLRWASGGRISCRTAGWPATCFGDLGSLTQAEIEDKYEEARQRHKKAGTAIAQLHYTEPTEAQDTREEKGTAKLEEFKVPWHAHACSKYVAFQTGFVDMCAWKMPSDDQSEEAASLRIEVPSCAD